MPAHAIIGAQWGDEGKGKLVDFLAQGYDAVVRFQGGNNAGHTVKVGDRVYKFHLLPSGAVRGRRVVIGNGVVVDPRVLLKEIDQLEGEGKRVRLALSDRAHIIMPYHVLLDGAREASNGTKIGTTKRGIGPCYADKMNRLGIRVGDLVDSRRLQERIESVYPIKRKELEGAGVRPLPTAARIFKEYAELGHRLRPYVVDSGEFLHRVLAKGGDVLFEGAQGVLLDIDHGTYPYVTASSTVAGNAAAGTGIPTTHLGPVLGVAKAYVTRVGEGPFPTEITTRTGIGKKILVEGHEFGTTTGRPRRVGWLDLAALAYAVRVGGITQLAITKLDVLSGIQQLKVCVGYRLNGKRLSTIPAGIEDFARVKPVWTALPGWVEAAKKTKGRWTLAPAARRYLRFVEQALGVPVVVGSVGPARDETLVLQKNPFLGP